MHANPVSTTIGRGSEPASSPFLRWARTAGLQAQAQALLQVLDVREARSDLLSVVLHRLARASSLLQSWAEEGADLYGLAQIAVGLRADPGLLARLPGRPEPPAHDILRDFPHQAESHYLYACLSVRDPVRASVWPWFDTLRVWLLVKNLARAANAAAAISNGGPGANRKSAVRDRLIEKAATRMRLASEEHDQTRWLDAISQIAGPQGWFALRSHFESLPSRLAGDGQQLLAPEREFHRLLRRIALDEADPATLTGHESAHVHWFGKARDTPSPVSLPVRDADAEEDVPLIQDLGLRDDEDEDEEVGAQLVEVDPDQHLAVQEAQGRAIQLLSGADARYLAWDWYGLTPPEATALRQLIDQSLNRSGADEALVASIAWVAQRIALSLGVAEQVRLAALGAEAIGADWALDIDGGTLFRLPPRRAGHWSPDDEIVSCLTPVAPALEIELDARVRIALAAARAATLAPRRLGDLWPVSSGETLRSAFRAWISRQPALRRITQGMLSQTCGREVFDATQDHVLARLLASHPASGLPASTAYAAYRSDQLPASLSCRDPETSGVNIAGSLLDPLAGFLHDGFARARESIAQLAQRHSAIEYHNAVTHYWDAALRAATGVRPFSERWIDAGALDEEGGFIVIDDKPGILGPRTRLVPLAAGLWERFRTSYLEDHIEALRQWLSSQGIADAERLGPRRTRLRAPQGPLLALLRVQGESLVQLPVGSAPPAPNLSPEAPLPRRTYRHWLRTQLHRAKADAEIVDSMFGHQDGATGTHGDYSMRVWRDDAQRIRPLLDRIIETLDIRPPAGPPSFSTFAPLRVTRLVGTVVSDAAQQATGRRATWQIHMRAARSAARMLSALLPGSEGSSVGGRLKLRELTSRVGMLGDVDRLEEMGRQLMLAPKGAPATLGPLRYAFFLRLMDRAWETLGERPPLRRRFLLRPRDDSPFRQSAAGAVRRRADAVSLLREATTKLVPSRMSLTEAGWFAIVDIALSSRCADRELQTMLMERRGLRLCRLGGDHYLEWSPSGAVRETDSPVQRLRISALAADALLQTLSSHQDRLLPQGEAPHRLIPLAKALCGVEDRNPTLSEMQAALADLTEQCNAIELPGTLAAYLAGRVRSASLHWGDWLALRTGQARDTRGIRLTFHEPPKRKETRRNARDGSCVIASARSVEGEKAQGQRRPRHLAPVTMGTRSSQDEQVPLAAAVRPQSAARGTMSPSDAQRRARKFLRQVRQLLQVDTRSARGPSGRPVAEASYRRDTRRAIERHVQDASGTVSSAVAALALWCASLLDRKIAGDLIRLSTVRRYLNALSPRFEAAGADADLLSMDDEEIEDFYGMLISLRIHSRRTYPAARLREFHRFGEQALRLPAIDWSEIAPDEEPQLCAPGFVDEGAFRSMLIALARAPEIEAAERLATRSLAILCYRAGLRAREAAGLRIDDLYLDHPPYWLAVDKNRLRELKSFAARRTVPMPHLRPLELRTLRRLVADATRIARGHAGTRALFADPTRQGQMLDVDLIKRTLNAAIRTAASQPHLSTHHLRHSFGNRLACELHPAISASICPAEWTEGGLEVRKLLGLPADRDHPTRRGIWALSRVIGHAHPRTTYFSYVHVLGDEAASVAFEEVVAWQAPDRKFVLDLDALPPAATVGRATRPPPQRLEAEHVLAMVCDLDSGTPPNRLPARYPIAHGQAREFAELLSQVEDRLPVADLDSAEDDSNSGRSSRKVPLARSGLMGHILQSRLPGLRNAIGTLYSARDRVASHGITRAEFVGMFGSMRNISMWRVAQFQLVADLVDCLDIAAPRLRLTAPADLSPSVADRAVRTNWLRHDANGTLAPARAGAAWTPDSPLDVVRFDNEPVRHRVMLSVARDTGAHVGTRWEFALMLLAVAPLIRFEAERE